MRNNHSYVADDSSSPCLLTRRGAASRSSGYTIAPPRDAGPLGRKGPESAGPPNLLDEAPVLSDNDD